MSNAIALGRYYLNHAQAAFSVLPEDGMTKKAEVILGMIREKNIMTFDRREAMRNCRKFKTVADIQPVLDFLDDYGYIMLMPDKLKASGRPSLPKYKVNPRIIRG